MMQKVICPKCAVTAFVTEAFCPACGAMLKGARPAPSSQAGVLLPQTQPRSGETFGPRPAVPPYPPTGRDSPGVPPSAPVPALQQHDRRAVFSLSPLMAGGLAAHDVKMDNVVFCVENGEGAVALVGTLDSVLVLRTSDLASGYRGINLKEYPYASISDVKSTPGPITGKLQFTAHMSGGKPAVGRKARMTSQKKVEVIAAVPNDKLPPVFEKFSEMVANLSDL